MRIALNIENGNQALYNAFSAILKTQPNLKFELKKERRTINGFTSEFEAEILKELKETKEAYKRKEIRTYSVKELKKALKNGEI